MMDMQSPATSPGASITTMPANPPNAATRVSAVDRERAVGRLRNQIRIAITLFVLVLLVVVTLGWVWTASHQPPPLRTASHVVLGIAALAGILALAKIWRRG
jgi:hypothetical protein